VGFESQTNVNDYYKYKAQLKSLTNMIGHTKFLEQEKEFDLSKEVSDLDRQIQQCEQITAAAYNAELKQTETTLKTLDDLMTQHEMYSLSEQKIKQIDEILAAYPHYVEAQTIDVKLKPLTQELLTLEAATNQALTLSKQLTEAKSFEQQIGTFRQLLEQRSQMITTLSTAYGKYTSWLYPEKVGPAIQNAVNDVLNSIALPRPITLEGEWDKNNFVWYVRDGNSRPPYEK
jgi:hypothetical protein